MVAVLFPLVVRLIGKTPDLEHATKLEAESNFAVRISIQFKAKQNS